MTELNSDKMVERDRYESRFANAINKKGIKPTFGSDSIAPYIRAPYVFYEELIRDNIKPEHEVLELGSGSGLHTYALLRTGAEVTATDIAPASLELLSKWLAPIFGEKLKTKVADMESLPFADASFDVVTCAGSLSYGDPVRVNNELARVMKTGATLICVDSLNHNPVYRLNRFVQFLRNQRTMSTIKRMPTLQCIENIGYMFRESDTQFFGTLTWAAPLLKLCLGQKGVANFLNKIDKAVSVRSAAFKFVFIGKIKLP